MLGTYRTRQDPSRGVQNCTYMIYILDKENGACFFPENILFMIF